MKILLWIAGFILIFATESSGQEILDEQKVEKKQTISHKHSELYYQGAMDAKKYYTKKTSGPFMVTWTTSIIGGPLAGLVPSISYASSDVPEKSFVIPTRDLYENFEYIKGYSDEANKIRRKKVWLGYGLGSVTHLALLSLILSAASY